MATQFPSRDQKAPNFWDQQLKAYIDERAASDAGVASFVEDPASQTREAIDTMTVATVSEVPQERSVYIPAVELSPHTAGAAPTFGAVVTRIQAWSLPDGGSPRLYANLRLPRDVSKFDIDIVWINPDATKTGDVKITTYYNRGALGADLSVVTNLGSTIVPVGGSSFLRRAPLARGVVFDRGMVPILLIDRNGTDAADTLTGAFGIVGVIVTPADQRHPELAPDAGWCWFNEPRLLADQTRGKMYASWVANNGDIGVSSLNVSTGERAQFTLRPRLERDDHDVPGMTLLADGNLIAFYSKHSIVDDPIYWRKTSTPGDISTFGAEQTITLPVGGRPCYPKPVLIGSRLYVFYRDLTNHAYLYSDDGGATWSTPAPLFTWSPNWRGYVNMVQNGDRVDFLCNDDNPNATSNVNLWHCYLQNGNLYKTDGTLIAPIGGSGIAATQMTKIYDRSSDVNGDGVADGDPWGWDIQLDENGRPVVVFATFPGATAASAADTNHLYHYARWTGSAWSVKHITSGGGTIVDAGGEWRYSGGLGLLSSDPNVVYLSRLVRGQFEMERWVTADGGASWTHTPLTYASTDKQVRPTTPERHYEGCPEVVWMSGWYSNYSNGDYCTRLVYKKP